MNDATQVHAQALVAGTCQAGPVLVMTPYEGLPVLFGLSGYWLLTGVYVSQLIKYFSTYRLRDRLLIRITVAVVTLATGLFSYLVIFISWRFFSIQRHVGGPLPDSLPVWSTLPSPTIAFVSTIVHFFFGWRIHMLRRTSKSVSCACAFIFSLSLTQFICATADFIRFNIAGRKLAGRRSFNTLTTLWLVGGLVCDIMITVTTSVLLLQVRKRTTLKGTSKLLTRLISGTLETGLPTSIMATAVLVTFVAYSQTNFDLCFMLMLYIVYANAFLTALNSRRHLRNISCNTMTSSAMRAAIGGIHSGTASMKSKEGTQPERKYDEKVDREAQAQAQELLPADLEEVDITARV